ncbi:hypothetical protein V7759_06995 [Bacillus sp. H7(2023)]|uniref:hypothetical protein n=1 Tax=Bacillus TaxID=1386 RepID=UPI0030003493
MTGIIKKVELKSQSFNEKKEEGLRRRCCKDTGINHVLRIERLLINYRYACYGFDKEIEEQALHHLLQALDYSIKQNSTWLECNWKSKGLSHADFESIFYEEAWKLCDNYDWYSDFYFYETFLVAIKNRRINITRKLITKKGEFEGNVLPLKEETAEFIADTRVDIETDIINSDLVARILNDSSLTEQERILLQAIYHNPDTSYRKLAEVVGLNHHEKVTRSLIRIKRKLFYIFS